MTDGPAGRHEKSKHPTEDRREKRKAKAKMCVRVWLEVGHACEPRSSALGRALALDWRVWVRGVSGHDISHFVHKVVFVLNPASAFVYPKRVIQEPPYEIQESGCASIDIPIHVYLKYSDKPKRIRLKYSLHIENSTKSSSKSRCVYYDVENPSEPLWRALMQGGGEVVARAAGGGLLLLLADGTPRLLHADRYECKFVEPLETPRRKEPKRARRVEEICPKCGDPTATDAELRKHLRAVAMTEDEIDRVSRLYRAYGAYERARARSPGALALPPLSDPIYRVPELPLSLRGALTSVEGDYAMQ